MDKTKKIGTQGYCMGGPLVMRTAAAVPNRIGAGASFHGGGLVTDTPESPHLLVPKMKARMYFGVAINDDERQPDAKDKLRAAFAAAKVPGRGRGLPKALHGWCMPDMPVQAGQPAIYNKADAEKRLGEAARVVQGRARLKAPGSGLQAAVVIRARRGTLVARFLLCRDGLGNLVTGGGEERARRRRPRDAGDVRQLSTRGR